MNFFTEIKELTIGMDVTIRIKEKNGKLTVSITPEIQDESKFVPLTMAGTPEELDEGFMDAVKPVLTDTKTSLLNVEMHKKSVADHVSDSTKAKAAPAKKEKVSSRAPKKEKAAKSKEVEAIATPDAQEEPSLF